MKKRIAALLLAVCMSLAGCTAGQADVAGQADGAEQEASSENTAAFAVNGEEIGLREWNFYVRMNQMQWEKSYLDSYGDDMWSMEVEEDKTTLADSLKEEVFETVCQIHLLNQHAEEYGVSLTEQEQEDVRSRAKSFMEAYHEALLSFAQADEAFVFDRLCEKELSLKVAEASVADYDPEISEEQVHREGICYVLISTTGLRDDEGNLTPFSGEEIERRTELAFSLCEKARESGDLKTEAEKEELTPIESSMGLNNANDGQEPRMLNAARALKVGEISDPIETEEGWFLVQHTSDYDEEGTAYWREYLTGLAKEERCEELYKEWKNDADIRIYQENMDQVSVKKVLKELL